MNLRLVVEILGWLLAGFGFLQAIPGLYAHVSGEAVLPFVQSALAAITLGLSIALSSRSANRRMRTRDGFLVVGGAWLMACAFGALPYWLSGTLSLADAFFESTSGVTATGATVMTAIEDSAHSLLLWRAISQWLGGMGIIVFAIAVLPLLGVGGMALFQAEVPGPLADKLTPRIADTARRLWLIYTGLTILAGIVYWALGMSAFDAVCHALTSISTAGFSTRDASIAAFNSPAIEWAVIAAMVAGGANFVLFWLCLSGRFGRLLRDSELRLYLGTLIFATAIATTALVFGAPEEMAFSDALRRATFQVVSIATTTGYVTADYETWAPLAQFVLLSLMIFGAMAGSTGGGVKTLHVLLAWRKLRSVVALSTHRHAIVPVTFRGSPVSENLITAVFAFLTAFFGLVAIGAIVVAAAGYDLLTAISASLSAVGNVGPAFGEVGPANHFAHFPGHVKTVLALCMIAGRLEILSFLVLLTPSFWRR